MFETALGSSSGCLLGLAFLLTVPAIPEQVRSGSLLESGRRAFANGDYVQAERDLRGAVAEAADGRPTIELALASTDLGGVLIMQGRFAEAEPFLSRAATLIEQDKSIDRRYLPLILVNLSRAYRQMGNLPRSERALQDAVRLGKEAFKESPLRLAELRAQLGTVRLQSGQLKEAERELKAALTLAEKNGGENTLVMARILANLSPLYYSQQKWDLAEQTALRSLRIAEEQLGPEHADLTETLGNLGVYYYRQKDFSKAESLMRRSIAIRQKAYGPENRDTTVVKGLLAQVLAASGADEEAERLYAEVLSEQERILGPRTAEVALTLEGYADLLRRTNHADRAVGMEARARSIRQQLTYTVSVRKEGYR
jgi:tetratricopeptide (TPR) repeat protein